MKKLYIIPTIEIVWLETENLMMTTSGETGGVGTGKGDADFGPELTKERRVGWSDWWK